MFSRIHFSSKYISQLFENNKHIYFFLLDTLIDNNYLKCFQCSDMSNFKIYVQVIFLLPSIFSY